LLAYSREVPTKEKFYNKIPAIERNNTKEGTPNPLGDYHTKQPRKDHEEQRKNE